MKKVTLNMLLGILLLSFASSGLAADVKTTIPVSKDQNLNLMIQEHVQSPAYKAARIKPTAACGTDGKVWACAPANAIKGQAMLNVDGVQIKNTLPLGKLESSKGSCFCERKDDNSPWVCQPPGCMGTFANSRLDSATNDRLTTPRESLTTPRAGGKVTPPRPN